MNRSASLLLLAISMGLLACTSTPPAGSPNPSLPAPTTPGTTQPPTAGPPTPAPTLPSATGPTGIQGRQFIATSVVDGGTDMPLVPGTRIVIDFLDELSANAGCNHLFGQYRLDGDTLLVDGMGGTEMGCQPALMAQDEWLVAFLTSRPTVTLVGADLTLTSGQVTMDLQDREVAEPDQPLQNITWTLSSMIYGDAVASVPEGVVATFLFGPDGTLALNAGCNSGGGPYAVEDDRIRFTEIALTRMACAGAANEVERHVVNVLSSDALTYSIDSATLTISDGVNGLIFEAAMDMPLR